MADNFIGDAWIVIRPDLSGFEAELSAGVTNAIARVQAIADAKPIQLAVELDTTAAAAQLAAIHAAGTGGVGGGGATAAGAAAGGGLITALTLQKILGIGAGTATHFGVVAAGAFSIGAFAGLDFIHILTVALGLVGSLAGAIAGGLILAVTALGVAFVGMGSDMLVMRSALANVKTIATAQEAMNNAIAQYGPLSAQAVTATNNYNFAVSQLPPVLRASTVATATMWNNTKDFWQSATASAQVAAQGIIRQTLDVVNTYIPLIAAAAKRNFDIIAQSIKPLFAWLSGPGTAIFKDLENVFARNLPTAIHAFTQAFELLFKIIDHLAPGVGGLVKAMDTALTRWNSPTGFPHTLKIVDTLVGIFHTWWSFLKILFKDVVAFFTLTAGVGTAIVTALTGMLTQLGNWLALTTTQTQLHNLFELHKQQVLDLLKLLVPLVSAMGHIYLVIAPPLTKALVTVLDVLVPILKIIVSNAWGAWAVGLAIIASKFGILGSVISGISGLVKFAFLNPWVLAIAAVITAVVLLVTHWQQVVDWVKHHIPAMIAITALMIVPIAATTVAIGKMIIAWGLAQVAAGVAAVKSAIAWVAFNVQFDLLLLQEKAAAIGAALAASAAWITSAVASTVAWTAQKVAFLLGMAAQVTGFELGTVAMTTAAATASTAIGLSFAAMLGPIALVAVAVGGLIALLAQVSSQPMTQAQKDATRKYGPNIYDSKGHVIGPGFAHAAGGVISAGMWGTAGEGPSWELLHALPGGGVRVYPNRQSNAMAGGNGPISLNLTIHNNSGTVAELQAVVRREFAAVVTAMRSGRPR